ncbi:MAG: type IV pilus assembly protein PilM [Pirellulales bacterium]|nr:type IV pilus assembly protein PilM [Pirellulales bacterium]
MAKGGAVWGIDIGQCAVKALRVSLGDTPGSAVADAFDYIEYPKILSQPEADPRELVAEALQQFLSRNSVRGAKVAISVSGQSGLARFIKLPPVESKKIPDIVKYEARQQIPFALEDVIWDYQQMAGGSVEEGFALETEVGLFAMKREQVERALLPFKEAGIEIDIVQLTPLALFNYVAFDEMSDLPPPEEYDPENPPESTVLLSLGTDTTDLVVTNGYRVWQRSLPLGGNHFTRALTKEMKLTFAKAEHLKRNAQQAEDPKALFQAMRPVFNDLSTEVQRSIAYFSSIDRNAKIGRMITIGNAMKLPGLQRFLQQNLGWDVKRVESFKLLAGPGVVDAPVFKENILSFAACYGLALQGLTETKIRTNLVPREIVRERMIRSKKPWAVGAAAALLLGLLLSAFGYSRQLASVDKDWFSQAVASADSTSQRLSGQASAFNTVKSDFQTTKAAGDGLLQDVGRRRLWLEVLHAINAAIPRDPQGANADNPRPIPEREEVHITSIECVKVNDVSVWATAVQPRYVAPAKAAQPGVAPPAEGDAAADGAMPPEGDPAAEPAAEGQVDENGNPVEGEETAALPTGPGWIFELKGYHYHNSDSDPDNSGANFVQNTLIKNLHEQVVKLPGAGGQELKISDLGIKYPVLLEPARPRAVSLTDKNAVALPDGTMPPPISAKQLDFVVQFAWIETPLSVREKQAEDGGGDAAAGEEPVAAN